MAERIDIEEIKQLINLIHDSFEKLKDMRLQSKKELSDIDKEFSNHYHNIEGTDFQYMCESHLYMMQLKNILDIRRDTKLNHTLLESYVTSLEKPLDKTKKRYGDIIEKHDEIIQEIKDRAKKPGK